MLACLQHRRNIYCFQSSFCKLSQGTLGFLKWNKEDYHSLVNCHLNIACCQQWQRDITLQTNVPSLRTWNNNSNIQVCTAYLNLWMLISKSIQSFCYLCAYTCIYICYAPFTFFFTYMSVALIVPVYCAWPFVCCAGTAHHHHAQWEQKL